MPLFSRKDKPLIPPVSQPSAHSTSPSPQPSFRSNSSTYNTSRDGDPYSSQSRGFGGSYLNGGERDRNELFSGYNPNKASSGRFFDGPQDRPEPAPGEEGEEDVEAIKKQTRFVKQESVQSTRNALRMAREAEETARNTVLRLGDQSEKLANTERHLDTAKGHTARAEDNTSELKQLNRSIFRPVITFNKESKRAAQEAKVQSRYDDERNQREKTMMDIRESQNRLGRAATYGRDPSVDEEGILSSGMRKPEGEKNEQRKRYQFEATASDDELEDELDTNLNEIEDVSKRLKALGTAMGQELDAQNNRVDRIVSKTDSVDSRLQSNTSRLKRIK